MIKFENLYNQYLDELKRYKILVVANVRNKTVNFKSLSLNSANEIEFFSENEFKEINTAIRQLGLFTKVYFNELSFFEDILNETYQPNEIIVINFARNGSREGKKSLVPSFCGKGCYGLHVHEKALEYGVKVTGATVHFVNEIPDGGKIIAQKAVEILENDTPETLQRRVMEQAEWVLLPQAVEKISYKLAKGKNEQ